MLAGTAVPMVLPAQNTSTFVPAEAGEEKPIKPIRVSEAVTRSEIDLLVKLENRPVLELNMVFTSRVHYVLINLTLDLLHQSPRNQRL